MRTVHLESAATQDFDLISLIPTECIGFLFQIKLNYAEMKFNVFQAKSALENVHIDQKTHFGKGSMHQLQGLFLLQKCLLSK